MTEDQEGVSETPIGPQKADSQPDKEIENVTRVDRIFIRLSILNTILAVAGVFTGAVALYAAITESEAVRRQSAAAVWPFVQIQVSNGVDEAGPYFSVELKNAGVGPAKIVSMQLIIEGEARRNWEEVVEAILPDQPVEFGDSFTHNRVLRPGESVIMIQSRDANLYMPFLSAANDPNNTMSYCYCSIFDECWLADSNTDIQDPQPVKQCPEYGDDNFMN